jgi:hypothetical protein
MQIGKQIGDDASELGYLGGAKLWRPNRTAATHYGLGRHSLRSEKKT